MKSSKVKTQSSKLRNAFTLIELLVVITIISILSTIGFTSYTAVTRNGRDAVRKSNLEQIRSALEIFRAQNSIYPATPGSCGVRPGTSPLILDSNYINVYPTDPVTADNYCYVQTGGGSGYNLCASLENGGAATGVCTNSCGSSGCNYQVQNP